MTLTRKPRASTLLAAAFASAMLGAPTVTSAHSMVTQQMEGQQIEIEPSLLQQIFEVLVPRAHAMGMGDTKTVEGFEGPSEPKGISFQEIGNIDLSNEIPGLDGRKMRARFWTIEPGGVVPVHSHADRPAHIYVVSGTIVEHASDKDEPVTYGPGDISVEANGVVHWWINEGDVPVELMAVDICNSDGGC